MSTALTEIAQSVREAIVELPQNRGWVLRDVFPLVSACDRLFDATLAAICRTEGSKGRMKKYFDGVRPEAYWEFLYPIFISKPIAEGKLGSLPLATRMALRSLLIRDDFDQSKNSEGDPLFEIKTALRLRRHLPEFFQAAADAVVNEELSAALRSIAKTLAQR